MKRLEQVAEAANAASPRNPDAAASEELDEDEEESPHGPPHHRGSSKSPPTENSIEDLRRAFHNYHLLHKDTLGHELKAVMAPEKLELFKQEDRRARKVLSWLNPRG
jgi:hypothetical protein